jgi:hypothetical protein
MPVLLYCVTQPSVHAKESQSGVAGVRVERVEGPGLAVFVSHSADSNVWLRAPVRTSALEFHRVLMKLFESAAIIPFRFPTIFASDDELGALLSERVDEYLSVLNRIADFVQMEVRVTGPEMPSAPSSGAEYLRKRQKHLGALKEFGARLRGAAAPVVKEWIESTLKDGQRHFALVERSKVAQLEQALRELSVPEGITARVSGPWPVREFLGTVENVGN